MRFAGFVACLIVALDCAEMAIGSAPQTLFAPSWLWLWWVLAFLWGVSSLKFMLGNS